MISSSNEHQSDAAGPMNSDGQRPDQRMSRKYYFNDIDMDLFFMSALSWGPAGGLDIGQAYYVAGKITDGDADSWVEAFSEYGEVLCKQANIWAWRGWKRAAGEQRLKAFAAFRSAWQFALPGSEIFTELYARHQMAFMQAMEELHMPAASFKIPFEGQSLPGLFLQNRETDAPVVLVIGGADTSLEDLFLSLGRPLFDRGFSVAIVDLPGQGMTAVQGLHWQTEPEHAISAVIDALISLFGARPGRIALLGISLGGYFVSRAAMTEHRLATVIASTPFSYPYELFSRTTESACRDSVQGRVPNSATQRSRQMLGWKAGADTPEKMLTLWRSAQADPTAVTVPFLSIVGEGDSPIFITQALDWHRRLASENKQLVLLDAATGADAHCQVNGRLRLIQEATGWMNEIFGREEN